MISVCIATYNGEKYIKEQLDSIISQLPQESEIVISDDGSTDKTLDIINEYNDSRIIIIKGPQQGVVKNFENALKKSSGEIIFLSDQDDIWEKDKVDIILKELQGNALCVLHDALVVDGKNEKVLMESFFEWRHVKHGVLNNLIKNSYTGCCMAFKRELLNKTLPFPDNIEMHDWWIGLIAEKNKSSVFLDERLIRYRRHDNNTNSLDGYGLKRKIHNRLMFVKALMKIEVC